MQLTGEPITITSTVRRDPVMGIDTLTSAVLEFPGGGQSALTCAIRSEPYQRVHIVGSEGRIEIEIPFNIPWDRETRIFLTSGGDPPEAPATETITFPVANAYTIEAELFGEAVRSDGAYPVSPEDAIANMRVIDAILDR